VGAAGKNDRLFATDHNSPSVTNNRPASVAAAGKLWDGNCWLKADSRRDIDAAFATLISQKAGALDIAANPFFDDDETISHLATLTLQHRIPGDFYSAGISRSSGLMSTAKFTPKAFDMRVSTWRILRGERPEICHSISPRR